MGGPNGAPPPQPQIIQPQPRPETWTIQRARMSDGTWRVVVQIHHEHGTHVSFLPLDFAQAQAAQMDSEATGAKSGLILPPGAGL